MSIKACEADNPECANDVPHHARASGPLKSNESLSMISPADQMPSILVVDDSPASRAVLREKLANQHVNIAEAEDGAIAWQRLADGSIDLAIVDLNMPNLDGYALLGCIRGHLRTRHMPVVVLTGSEDRSSMEKSLVQGATSYLIKPLNWVAFGDHIKHLLKLSQCARISRPSTEL